MSGRRRGNKTAGVDALGMTLVVIATAGAVVFLLWGDQILRILGWSK